MAELGSGQDGSSKDEMIFPPISAETSKPDTEMVYTLTVVGNDDYDFVEAMRRLIYEIEVKKGMPLGPLRVNEGSFNFQAVVNSFTTVRD